jgi:hypothetical protein
MKLLSTIKYNYLLINKLSVNNGYTYPHINIIKNSKKNNTYISTY